MDLTGKDLTLLGEKFTGCSLAGIRTSITVKNLSLTFDVAQGLPFAQNSHTYCITHGHMDHCGGIPYIISQKGLLNQKPPSFYMPSDLVEPLENIMQQWQKIEGFQYEYQFIGVNHQQEYNLKPGFSLRSFPTIHRVASNGYTIFKHRKKLKIDFKNKTGQEIRELKEKGIEVEEIHSTPYISFSGDTQIEFLDENPWVRNSEILFLEATYLSPEHSRDKAKQWGHIHLDEIIERIESFNCKHIVLIHASARYSKKYIQEILSQFPKHIREVLIAFPGR